MNDDIVIKVDNVSKTFKLPHEKTTSIKGVVINFYKRNKSYETQQALKDVSFEVKKGDFFGIVGRNGSGKSTLLKLLAGIYSPSKGGITIDGKLTPFIELGVGFNQELSGRENVYLNGALLGFNRKEMDAMYDDIVDFAEIERFMDQKLKNYSSGMQVRLAFSIAIRARSDILLLDEVLAVGDAAFQQKCFDYFEELKRQKKTVVFVTHDMGAVRRFCTRAIYIKNSKLIKEGTPFEIADIYLEENMKNTQRNAESEDQPKTSNKHTIKGHISQQTDSRVLLEIEYRSENEEKMYAGISIFSGGMPIAEITTDPDKPLTGSGRITYSLDTAILNAGPYQIGIALFKLDNRELLSVYKKSNSFLIKGADVTKGAALKLMDTWQYDQ